MSNEHEKMLLVGDNPFHSISHLSQERARGRGGMSFSPARAASLIESAMENGANGFMFSVSETTLSILREVRKKGKIGNLSLYAIVPYAFEYVRLATQVGGIPGLAKRLAKEIVMSGNLKAISHGIRGTMGPNPVELMKTYLEYEITRIRNAAGKNASLSSVMLHEVMTDMALALDLDWLFKSYINFMIKKRIRPGFNTGNFAYLVRKFNEWNIDVCRTVVAAPFNKVGFQMIPSRIECERTLSGLSGPSVVAISILAAGYLDLPEAAEYVASLPNMKGVAVGVSKESHARETFSLLKEKLETHS